MTVPPIVRAAWVDRALAHTSTLPPKAKKKKSAKKS